jgi:hypothetical protein
MKAIKASLAGAGLALALFAAGATGAGAQALQLTIFSGTTQLPLEAEWQGKTLPAGEYALYYGTRMGGTHYVEIEGKTEGTPHLFITPRAYSPSSSVQNELLCARRGNRLVVLELQMSGLGESLAFAMPGGAQRMAEQTGGETLHQVAAAEPQIQRVSVATKRK